MKNLTEYSDLESWSDEVKSRDLKVVVRSGHGEDPYTHYYAVIPYRDKTDARLGYFGDANGADSDHGVLCKNAAIFDNWMDS